MTKTALTDAKCRDAKLRGKSRNELWDVSRCGLGLRVGTRAKIWVFKYRFGGRQHRLTLGPYPRLSLRDAQKSADAIQDLLFEGQNPKSAPETWKSGPVMAPEGTPTVSDVVDLYIERFAKTHQPRSWDESVRTFAKDVQPKWGTRPITSITSTDVQTLLDEVAARAPVQANRVRTRLFTLFKWASAPGRRYVSHNPVDGIAKPHLERARDRVLTDDELSAIWSAAASMEAPFGPWIQFLMLTGQRRKECAGLEWSQIRDGAWHMPAELNKVGTPLIVPLTDLAFEVLERLPRFKGPFAFTSTHGEKPVSGYAKAKRLCDVGSQVKDWTFHDLRRTLRSELPRLGFHSEIAERVLGHKLQGMEGVYNRYDYLAEKRAALNVWSNHIHGLTVERDVVALTAINA